MLSRSTEAGLSNRVKAIAISMTDTRHYKAYVLSIGCLKSGVPHQHLF